MEAQLLEWGALLAGLGEEPPPKPTPRARKVAKTSLSSIGTSRLDSPSHAQWKEKWKQIEMSPIFEHKVLPRAAAEYVINDHASMRQGTDGVATAIV